MAELCPLAQAVIDWMLADSICVLQEQGMLGRSPEEVAKFLAKSAGLNKTMIGEYLGEFQDTCIKVMHAYVDALQFTNMDFDAAIRQAH